MARKSIGIVMTNIMYVKIGRWNVLRDEDPVIVSCTELSNDRPRALLISFFFALIFVAIGIGVINVFRKIHLRRERAKRGIHIDVTVAGAGGADPCDRLKNCKEACQ